MYNFSVYVNCYSCWWGSESFYISQYFRLKDSLFKEIDNAPIESTILENFCYYNYDEDDGTLLHTVSKNFVTFCILLIEDGFDVNKCNHVNQSGYSIAKKNNHLVLLSFLEVMLCYVMLCLSYYCCL